MFGDKFKSKHEWPFVVVFIPFVNKPVRRVPANHKQATRRCGKPGHCAKALRWARQRSTLRLQTGGKTSRFENSKSNFWRTVIVRRKHCPEPLGWRLLRTKRGHAHNAKELLSDLLFVCKHWHAANLAAKLFGSHSVLMCISL